MPKIKSNTSKRKMTITRRPVLIVIIILIIALVGLLLAKILTNNAADGENQSDDTTSEVTSQTETLGTSTESSNTDADYNNPQTPKQYEGPNVNTYDNLTGSITYAEVEGDNLYIGTNIDQFLSSGTCTLMLSQDSEVVTKIANITTNPTTSTCDGFTVPIDELSSGFWEITINLNANNKTGTLKGKVNI